MSFTASNISQKVQLAEGFTASPFLLTIINQPDNTSVIICNQRSARVYIFITLTFYLKVGSSLTCTFSPRFNSISIYTTPAFFSFFLNQYLDSNLTSNDLSTSLINLQSVVLRGNNTGSDFGFISSASPVLGDLFQFTVYAPRFDGVFSISSSIGIDPYFCIIFVEIFIFNFSFDL